MKLLPLIFLITSFSFAAGWVFTDSLTVNPAKIYRTVFIFTVLLFLNIALLILSAISGFIAVPLVTAFAFFIAGYMVRTRNFLSGHDTVSPVEITRKPGEKGSHTAVIYFTHGEPETYNPIGWLKQFREFDEQGIKFIPWFARPAFIYILRQKYLDVGRSNHRQGHKEMMRRLEERYRQEGDTTIKFYLAFLDDYPHPDAAVINSLNEGASSIIVCNVFLTISNHTAEGRKLVDNLGCRDKYGVEISYTEPLWNSETLMKAFIDKICSGIGTTPKEKVAVALIGHGQPVEWDREWPTLTDQEIKFREGIIDLLVNEGFRKENLGSAWMEFREPKPYDLMGRFVENGVEKVFYFAAAISADAIHSQSDIPAMVNEYPFPENIEVINLGAWNAHPLVISAIKERIDSRLQALSK